MFRVSMGLIVLGLLGFPAPSRGQCPFPTHPCTQTDCDECQVDGDLPADDCNSGWNGSVHFQNLHCGNTICGEISTFESNDGSGFNDFRDNDWFLFQIFPEPEDIEVTVEADFPGELVICRSVPGVFCASVPLLSCLFDEDCQPVACTLPDAEVGVYYLRITVANFVGFPCGGPGNHYRFTFNTSKCPPPPPPVEFIRGDADGSGDVSFLADMLYLLRFAFTPGIPAPPCLAAVDVDGNRELNGLVDGVFGLNAAFSPGAPLPPAPYPDCAEDPLGEELWGCEDPPSCP